MTQYDIDPAKISSQARRLHRSEFLRLFDRAIGLLPDSQLEELIRGIMDKDAVRGDGRTPEDLLAAVRHFHSRSLSGAYYESFRVNSHNCSERSRGTEAWIAECERLFRLGVKIGKTSPTSTTREAFDVLFDLMDQVDHGREIVFWADEGGSYEVWVDWDEVFPVYFEMLAADTLPEDYAKKALDLIRTHAGHEEAKRLIVAAAAGNTEQREALEKACTPLNRRR